MPTRHRSQPTALEIALIASAGVRAEARHSVQEQVQLLEKLVGIDRPSVRALLVLSNKAITSLQTSTEALEAEALSMYYALSSAFEQQRRVADGAMQELKNQQMQYEDALSTMRTEFLANRKKLQQALGEVDELGKTLAEQERLAREREAKALDIQAAAHASVVENWKRALETQEASSTKQIDELKASLQDAEKGRKQAVADKEAAKKEFNELSRQLKEKSHMEAREANARINELETSRDRDQAQLAQLTMQLDEEDRARRKLESRTQAKLEKMRKAVDLDTPGAAVRARTMLYAEMNLQAPPGSAVRSPRATSPP